MQGDWGDSWLSPSAQLTGMRVGVTGGTMCFGQGSRYRVETSLRLVPLAT